MAPREPRTAWGLPSHSGDQATSFGLVLAYGTVCDAATADAVPEAASDGAADATTELAAAEDAIGVALLAMMVSPTDAEMALLGKTRGALGTAGAAVAIVARTTAQTMLLVKVVVNIFS